MVKKKKSEAAASAAAPAAATESVTMGPMAATSSQARLLAPAGATTSTANGPTASKTTTDRSAPDAGPLQQQRPRQYEGPFAELLEDFEAFSSRPRAQPTAGHQPSYRTGGFANGVDNHDAASASSDVDQHSVASSHTACFEAMAAAVSAAPAEPAAALSAAASDDVTPSEVAYQECHNAANAGSHAASR